jgi:hypothetical protein
LTFGRVHGKRDRHLAIPLHTQENINREKVLTYVHATIGIGTYDAKAGVMALHALHRVEIPGVGS